MKGKKIVLSVVALLGATTLAACTGVSKKIVFSEYWQENSSAPAVISETLEYAITFDKGNGIGLEALDYKLSYGEGTYKTILTSTNLTEGTGYTYTTEMKIPVTYELGNTKQTYNDVVTSTVTFLEARQGLRPIKSEKNVESHTPTQNTPTKLEDCFKHYKYETETTYKADGTGSSTVTYTVHPSTSLVGKPQTSSFEYGKEDYTYLDNEQLFLALRAVPTSSTSGTFECYNPYDKTMQNLKFSFGSVTGKPFTHTVNGTPLSGATVNYREVTLKLDARNAGATQTAWIANATDASKNPNRNVLLKLSVPIFYNIGTLVYELKTVTNA